MAYVQIEYEPTSIELAPRAQALVEASELRFEDFYAKQLNKRYPRYIASDPSQVDAALRWLERRNLVMGGHFLEWGSGFGLATGLASLRGYQACGIELRRGLVEIARDLMAEQKIEADFLCTSYIPEGYIAFESADGEDIVPDDSFGYERGSPPCYEADDLVIEITEVDLFYVYPWPGEQTLMLKLFDAVAGPDAILIAYYGDRDLCLYRKK
ncbi:MAG: hypothetical protein ACLFS1_10850 [Opitutales bacterium]